MATQRDKHEQSGGTAVADRPEQGGTGSGSRSISETSQTRGGESTGTALRRAPSGWPGNLVFGGTGASPWDLIRQMSDDMDRLFQSLGTGLPPGSRSATLSGRGTTSPPILLPQIEVTQRSGNVVVRADLPGLKTEDIDVRVENGTLTLSGERRQENRQEREGFVQSEVTYGTFYRTIPLPPGADESRVSATFRNGVLEVSVPISEKERGRHIKVQS
jgi:HSP20 family protein